MAELTEDCRKKIAECTAFIKSQGFWVPKGGCVRQGQTAVINFTIPKRYFKRGE